MSGRDVVVLPNGVKPGEWESAPAVPESLCDHLGDAAVQAQAPARRGARHPAGVAKLPASLRPVFTLVGDGPERPKVERESGGLGVGSTLELLGWQPRPEVKKVLARSSLFILPTCKEALGSPRSRRARAPAARVAMSHGGVGDIIHQGREGYLANTREEFIARIVEVMSDASCAPG